MMIPPYIESMPETQFTVFFPPYSVLYRYSCSANGRLKAEIYGEKRIIEMLLSYPNVSVYYFQNLYDFITDLNHYCDYTHYIHEMNDYMTRCFADGTCQLTEENYEEILNEIRQVKSLSSINWVISVLLLPAVYHHFQPMITSCKQLALRHLPPQGCKGQSHNRTVAEQLRP